MGSLSLETIYFYGLLVCAGIAILLFLFGDIFEFDGPLDPMLDRKSTRLNSSH